MLCSLGSFKFLEDISSLSYSIFPLYFFALITEEGFLISPCYSLELRIQMGISFLFSIAFRLSYFTAICKASSDNHFYSHQKAQQYFSYLLIETLSIPFTFVKFCIYTYNPWLLSELLIAKSPACMEYTHK